MSFPLTESPCCYHGISSLPFSLLRRLAWTSPTSLLHHRYISVHSLILSWLIDLPRCILSSLNLLIRRSLDFDHIIFAQRRRAFVLMLSNIHICSSDFAQITLHCFATRCQTALPIDHLCRRACLYIQRQRLLT